jgi:hypothetical protein
MILRCETIVRTPSPAERRSGWPTSAARGPPRLPADARLNAAVALAKAGTATVRVAHARDRLAAFDPGRVVERARAARLRWAAAPADARHPYGPPEDRDPRGLGIGVLIVVGLFELRAPRRPSPDRSPPRPRIGVGGFAIVLATIAINLWVARYERRKASRAGERAAERRRRHTQSGPLRLGRRGRSFVAVRAGWLGDGGRDIAADRADRHAAWEVFRERPRLIDAAMLDAGSVAHVCRRASPAAARSTASDRAACARRGAGSAPGGRARHERGEAHSLARQIAPN